MPRSEAVVYLFDFYCEARVGGEFVDAPEEAAGAIATIARSREDAMMFVKRKLRLEYGEQLGRGMSIALVFAGSISNEGMSVIAER